jgi:hypothetical protein
MLKASELKEEVLRLAADLLSTTGWERVGRQSVFARQIAPKIESRLNFSCILRNNPASVQVTPYVEIVHSDVENARRMIIGRRLYTINSQLRVLMDDAKTHARWIFSERRDIRPVAERLVIDSLTYGVPFTEQFLTLEDITMGLERLAIGKRTIMRESLAICYCLQRMLDKAAEILADEVEAARSNPRDVAHDRLPKYEELFGLTFSF